MEREKVVDSLGHCLGLSRAEAEIYLYVSSNPSVNASAVAKDLGIARSKAYDALSKLVSMGLLAKISQDDGARYHSSGTSVLKGMCGKRMDDVEKSIDYLKGLDMLRPSETRIKMVEGEDGYKIVKESFLSRLRSSEEMLVVGSPSVLLERLYIYFDKFHKKRIKKGIKLRIIYNDDVKKERTKYAKKWKQTEMRYFPNNNSPAWIEIYGDNVMIPLASDKMITIAITDKAVATNFRNYFEFLWETSKKKKH